MKKTIKILSIDGGGMRGVIPASVLCEIERRINEKGCRKPFHKIFDLMAGTSTGGLITLALSVPVFGKSEDSLYSVYGGLKPQAILDLYQRLGAVVFRGYNRKFIKTVRQLFRNKYSPKPLENILNDVFSNHTMHEGLTNLLITSFDMIHMQPLFFKKRPKDKFKDDEDFYMRDSARATSAVPTYFPSAMVKPVNRAEKEYCLTDGGVFCINPSLSAFIEARKIYPDAEKYIILSLGTGKMPIGFSNTRQLQNWGFFEWMAPWKDLPLLAAEGEGQKISTNHMLKRLPSVELYRFDITLDKGRADMDDGSTKNINYLKKKASELIMKNNDKINELCRKLAKCD